MATGESCTGGMLASRLVDRAGSSAYVAGGVVAYSNAAKTALLGVPAELIAAHGAVSPEVARALADGARERFGADLGVGITGVAGPDGGTAAKPVGYVCLCVTTGRRHGAGPRPAVPRHPRRHPRALDRCRHAPAAPRRGPPLTAPGWAVGGTGIR